MTSSKLLGKFAVIVTQAVGKVDAPDRDLTAGELARISARAKYLFTVAHSEALRRREATIAVNGWVALGALVALLLSVVFAYFQVRESLLWR